MSLESLAQEVGGKIPPIAGIGGIMVNPEGFVMMNIQIPCVKGYNEDQIAIVMDDPGLKDCPVILGMPTIFQVPPRDTKKCCATQIEEDSKVTQDI